MIVLGKFLTSALIVILSASSWVSSCFSTHNIEDTELFKKLGASHEDHYLHTYIGEQSPLFVQGSNLVDDLFSFTQKHTFLYPTKAIYVHVLYENAWILKHLNEMGFENSGDLFKEAVEGERTRIGQTWIFRNQSDVPPTASFSHTSRMLLVDSWGYFLMVTMGPALTFPGGVALPGENPLATATRELEEELPGMHVHLNPPFALSEINVEKDEEDREYMRRQNEEYRNLHSRYHPFLVGILYRKSLSDPCGLKAPGDTSFYFLTRFVVGKEVIFFKRNEEEIAWAGWMHWTHIVNWSSITPAAKAQKYPDVAKYSIGNHIKLFVNKVMSGALRESPTHELPDFHTLYSADRRVAAAKIWSPTMTLMFPEITPLNIAPEGCSGMATYNRLNRGGAADEDVLMPFEDGKYVFAPAVEVASQSSASSSSSH